MKRTGPALLALLAAGALVMAEEPKKPAAEKPAQPAATQQNRAQQQTQQQAPGAAPGAEGRQQRQANFRPADSAGIPGLDSHLADCLIVANQQELALLRLGAQRTKNEEVKKFAEQAIQAHEKAIADLRKFSSGNNTDLAAASATPAPATAAGERREVATTREARRVGTEDRAGSAAGGAGSNDAFAGKLLEIHRQAAQECLNTTQQDLAKLQGDKFDQAFLGTQIGMHQGMQSWLKAIENNVSGELQQVVQKSQDTVMQHKQDAERLKNQTAKEAPAKTGTN